MARANCTQTYAEVVSEEKFSAWSQLWKIGDEEALTIAIRNSLEQQKVFNYTLRTNLHFFIC